jgi:hypothetical protein
MAFKVLSAVGDGGDSVYYEQAFRTHIESHLNILRFTNPRTLNVKSNELWQFEGNLYGYLSLKDVPPEIHWVIMRVNNMHNPNEFGRKVPEYAMPRDGDVLLIPDQGLLDSIRSLYLGKKEA